MQLAVWIGRPAACVTHNMLPTEFGASQHLPLQLSGGQVTAWQ
jgi:hypothetical protein